MVFCEPLSVFAILSNEEKERYAQKYHSRGETPFGNAFINVVNTVNIEDKFYNYCLVGYRRGSVKLMVLECFFGEDSIPRLWFGIGCNYFLL